MTIEKHAADDRLSMQEGAPEQDLVRLLSACEIDGGEGPELEDFERGDRDPGCVEGWRLAPAAPPIMTKSTTGRPRIWASRMSMQL